MTSPDWDAIELACRAGGKSVRQIAAEHGVSHVAILKRAKSKGWTTEMPVTTAPLVTTKPDTGNHDDDERAEFDDPDCLIGTATDEYGASGALAVYQNEAGQAVIGVKFSGAYAPTVFIVVGIATLPSLIKRLRTIALDAATSVTSELQETP